MISFKRILVVSLLLTSLSLDTNAMNILRGIARAFTPQPIDPQTLEAKLSELREKFGYGHAYTTEAPHNFHQSVKSVEGIVQEAVKLLNRSNLTRAEKSTLLLNLLNAHDFDFIAANQNCPWLGSCSPDKRIRAALHLMEGRQSHKTTWPCTPLLATIMHVNPVALKLLITCAQSNLTQQDLKIFLNNLDGLLELVETEKQWAEENLCNNPLVIKADLTKIQEILEKIKDTMMLEKQNEEAKAEWENATKNINKKID